MLDTLVDATAVSAAGIFVPYVLAVLNQPFIPRRYMLAIAVTVSVAVGATIAYFTGAFNGHTVLQDVVAVLAIAQVFYRTLGQRLGLPQLEAATNMPTAGTPAAGDNPTQDDAPSTTEEVPAP